MSNQLIADIEQALLQDLDNQQMEKLHQVLSRFLRSAGDSASGQPGEVANEQFLASFIAAKRVEGRSARTLRYYESTLKNMLDKIDKPLKRLTTNDLRQYLDSRQREGRAGKVTVDNIRRILSSFFNWLEDEACILKSPVRRIHKVKTAQTVKETYSDEALEVMRDSCGSARDLAMIDLLASTGIRVGELVNLNRRDIDFQNRECLVFGKGDKERKVYFDARTKIHLRAYLEGRGDSNPALFVTLQKPNERLHISGVEIRLRALGQKLSMPRVHPHKFRRTLATMALDKGMPIEQVQLLLGHKNVDTTLQYAMVNHNNVKISCRRFIG